ncbi:MAG: VanZ family protein [Clostridia bacterium]|nr:VanZ family protein [Clostridia bacterium]
MNKNIKKIISAILVVIWMIVIFSFSAMPADESDKQSKGIIYLIAEKIEGKNGNEIKNIGELNHLIRKCAHANVYFVLCILVMNSINQITEKNNKPKYFLYGIGICFVYACTDEFHQIFVEGRAGQFKDILIDTGGASLGCGLFYLINKIINKKSNKIEKLK